MKNTEELSDRLVDIATASKLLKIQSGTLRSWIIKKKYGIQPIKIGRKTFIDRNKINEILEEALEPKECPHAK